MTDGVAIRAIEEIAMAAQPALRTVHYDGWVLRFSEGHTRRANSVHPLYPSTIDIDAKIAHCGDLYAAQGLPVVFKMTRAAEPAELDDALEERGFGISATTSVQVRGLGVPFGVSDHAVTLGAATDAWLDAFCRLTDVPPLRRSVLVRMLDGIVTPAAYASIAIGGEVVAVGLGVVVHGWVGLYDLATAEPVRRRGLGRSVVTALLRWGAETGATAAYLQVMLDNTPAAGLYGNLGFTERYRYWYRSRP